MWQLERSEGEQSERLGVAESEIESLKASTEHYDELKLRFMSEETIAEDMAEHLNAMQTKWEVELAEAHIETESLAEQLRTLQGQGSPAPRTPQPRRGPTGSELWHEAAAAAAAAAAVPGELDGPPANWPGSAAAAAATFDNFDNDACVDQHYSWRQKGIYETTGEPPRFTADGKIACRFCAGGYSVGCSFEACKVP